MVQRMPITYYREYQILSKNFIPDLTPDQAEMIQEYWPVFWKNPEGFKDTDLKDIIMTWVKSKKWQYDEEPCKGTPHRDLVDIKEE